MKQKFSAKIILIILGCALTVLLTVLALVPFLNNMLDVKVAEQAYLTVTPAPLPEKPEAVPVTVYYVMEENSKKISVIYIEVFPVGETTVTYMELPVDTRVDLSEDLFKSLQSYAPELPQYLKLANMAESFSVEYGLTGCNRILSELLGFSLTEYVRTGSEAFEDWKNLFGEEEKTDAAFFEGFSQWVEKTSSSRTVEERWMYYESWKDISAVVVEIAPGSREKDGYLVSGKRSRERLEELIRRQDTPKESEE